MDVGKSHAPIIERHSIIKGLIKREQGKDVLILVTSSHAMEHVSKDTEGVDLSKVNISIFDVSTSSEVSFESLVERSDDIEHLFDLLFNKADTYASECSPVMRKYDTVITVDRPEEGKTYYNTYSDKKSNITRDGWDDVIEVED